MFSDRRLLRKRKMQSKRIVDGKRVNNSQAKWVWRSGKKCEKIAMREGQHRSKPAVVASIRASMRYNNPNQQAY